MKEKTVLKVDRLGDGEKQNEFKQQVAEPAAQFITELSGRKVGGEECPMIFIAESGSMKAFMTANTEDDLVLAGLINNLVNITRLNPVIIAETMLFTTRTDDEKRRIMKENNLRKRRKMVFDSVMKDAIQKNTIRKSDNLIDEIINGK